MATPQLDPYDEFPYTNYSYPQTHIDSLATLATLFGMRPAPVENCRVLELACGDGSNLMPMAYALPESRFLGIDRAAKPIIRGTELIKALQLKNLEVRQSDLIAVTEELGEFDYIIVHGLYSWVTADVRDRIMELCRSCLAPQGVAYISYNVYPGYHMRKITREMMLFHTRRVKDPRERVVQSRAVAQWAADVQTKSNPYSLFLREIKDVLNKADDAAIRHDIIAEVNEPVYFHQFMSHAALHGLQFLSEAEHFNIREYEFGPDVAQELSTLAEENILTKEQYLDFLGGRSFRQTLLCHQQVEIDRSLRTNRIREFYLASQARPASPKVDLQSTKAEKFCVLEDASVSTNFPLAKAALFHLGQIFPRALRFDDLLIEASQLLGTRTSLNDQETDEVARTFAELIFKSYGVGVVKFHLHVPRFTVTPGERPLASQLARLQAQRGTITTTLLGNNVRFEDLLSRQFLMLLNGARDRVTLANDFGALIASSVQPEEGDKTAPDKTKLLQNLPEQIEEKLADLGRRGFLLE